MSAARLAILFALFCFVALLVTEPALRGPFHSDDVVYVERNPYVQSLSLRNVAEILNPMGDVVLFTANYAPVHMLAHALEWSIWGPEVVPYHVVNVLLHALAATLLAALLASRGLGTTVCVLGGAVFLLHPANVETVAWISQLKSLLALVLALAALLAHPRRPGLGLALFTLALLSKPAALFALPLAAVLTWNDHSESQAWRHRWTWIAGWAVVFLVLTIPQLYAFQRTEAAQPLHPDTVVALRTFVAIGGRYLAMAFLTHGISPFHEPDPALSWLDPYWLIGLVGGAAVAGRCTFTLLQRREEAAWWAGALAAYLPISQIFRFTFPMADRYLYFILPGLIGATIFAGRELWQRLATGPEPLASLSRSRAAAFAGLLAGALLLVGLAERSHEQARVWRSPLKIALTAERNYPNGRTAHMLRARRAAKQGDAAEAARQVRGASDLGFDRFMDLQTESVFARVRRSPEFAAAIRETAGNWIAVSNARSNPGHVDLYWRAKAYQAREEPREAEAAFEQALQRGGSYDVEIRKQLEALRSDPSPGL